MNIFNEAEFLSICKKLSVQPYSEELEIKCSSSYLNRIKRSIKKDRRGEVVFCVVRPNGKIILITCKKYPRGIFRIPTGGIKYNEDVIDAVFRETKEELGLEVEIAEFVGVLKIKFTNKSDFEMFYSYLFILNEVKGRLLEDASDDEVSEVKEVDLNEFYTLLKLLKRIDKSWEDWGKFRYQTSKAIFNHMKKSTG
jgi:ADP-ribose pyrophosphatase YjhB (NUDIX family)